MRVPCFRAVANLASSPLYLAGPKILSHISRMLVLYVVSTSSVVTSPVEDPLNIQEFFDSEVREILFALYGGFTLFPFDLLKMSFCLWTDGLNLSQYS